MRSKKAPINGPLLCAKAEEIAEALGHDDFKATNGWFYRWKIRYGLIFKNIHGEAQDADVQYEGFSRFSKC